MGSEALGHMIVTSLSAVPAGLYFLLMVESVDDMRAYRYKFLPEGDALDKINNAISVGIVGYSLFILSIPVLNWFTEVTFSFTVTEIVSSVGIVPQLFMLTLLAITNMVMAYLGLQK